MESEVLDPVQNELIIRHNSDAPEVNPAMAFIATLHGGTSRYTMTSKLNVIAHWAGAKDLRFLNWSAMRYEHVLAFITAMQQPDENGKPRMSPRSINCYLSAFKGVANQAFLLKQMDAETLARIKLVKSIRFLRLAAGRAITADESEALLDATQIEMNPITIRDHAILCLLLGCGMRRAEVSAIKLKGVNLADSSIRFIGKGDKEREVFLIPEVKDALARWLDVRGKKGEFVFGKFFKGWKFDPSAPLTPHAVGHVVQEYRIRAGLEDITTHDLRRTFATRLLDRKVDISTVKDMMGHASITTTALYDRRGRKAQREAAKKVKL